MKNCQREQKRQWKKGIKMKNNQKNIPDGWKPVAFGRISKIYDGTHQTPFYVESGVPFYSVEHITSNNFSDTKYISEDVYLAESKRVKIEKGDILMSRIGDIGTARYVDWEVRASFYVTLALIKCIHEVNAKFIAFLINSAMFKREILKRTLQVAFPNKINLGDISKCESIIPPLIEQNRIVAVLETWDRAIEKFERKIKLKKLVKKGLLQHVLTGKKRLPGFSDKWQIKPLGKICEITTGKKDVNEGSPFGKYPFFTCAKNHTYSDSYSFDTEAILIAGNGEVGNCLYYKGKFEAYQRTYVLSDFEVSAYYSFQYLRYFFQNSINSQKQMGAMPYIKLGMIKDFPITYPTLSKEIENITQVLLDCDTDITYLVKKFELLKRQKTYLLNNLITGAIRTPEHLHINS